MKNVVSGEEIIPTVRIPNSIKKIIEDLPDLAPESPVVSILPDGLLNAGTIHETIVHMAKEGRKWIVFSPDMMRSVFDRAYSAKETHETVHALQERHIEEQIGAIDSLKEILKKMIFSQFDMNPRTIGLATLIGDYYLLFEEEPDIAQSYYNMWAGLGDITAILRSVPYYVKRGELWVALSFLDAGWATSEDPAFIEKSIEIFFIADNLTEAKNRYAFLLEKFPDHELPILAYKWKVESDEDLSEFEDLMNIFYLNPYSMDEDLVLSARQYMEKEINDLMNEIERADMDPEYDFNEKRELVFRRLSYMEKHVFLLLDDACLEAYLEYLDMFLSGEIDMRSLLATYFELYPSNLLEEQIRFDDRDQIDRERETCLSRAEDVEEKVVQRLVYIMHRFAEFPKKEAFLFESPTKGAFHAIAEIGRKHLSNFPNIEAEAEEMAWSLWKERQCMDEISPDIAPIYENIAKSLDVEHGTHFRRHMQYIARHPYRTKWGNFPEILTSMPLAGMFFITEAILSDSLPAKDIAFMIDRFSLRLLPLAEIFTLASILVRYEFYEECANYLAQVKWIFFEPQFLWLMMECIVRLDRHELIETMKKLNAQCKKEYGEKSLLSLLENEGKKVYGDKNTDPWDLDAIDIAMGHGNILKGETKMAIENFTSAANRDSVEGLIQCARILEHSENRQEDALDTYIHAYSLRQKYKRTEIVQNIINLATRLQKPMIRDRYIQVAMRYELLDPASLFALDLYGNDEDQCHALRSIAKNRNIILEETEINLLDTLVDDSITNEILSTKLATKKFLLASYVRSQEYVDGFIQPDNLLDHWIKIASLLYSYDKITYKSLEEKISEYESLCFLFHDLVDMPENPNALPEEDAKGEKRIDILGDIVYLEPYADPYMELSTLIHAHAYEGTRMFGLFIEHTHRQGEHGKGMAYLKRYMELVGIIIATLRTVPGAEPYLERWQTELDKNLSMEHRVTTGEYMAPGNHTYLQ